jgi:hypothetical protein
MTQNGQAAAPPGPTGARGRQFTDVGQNVGQGFLVMRKLRGRLTDLGQTEYVMRYSAVF